MKIEPKTERTDVVLVAISMANISPCEMGDFVALAGARELLLSIIAE